MQRRDFLIFVARCNFICALERLLRLYAEAASKDLVAELLATGEQFVRSSA